MHELKDIHNTGSITLCMQKLPCKMDDAKLIYNLRLCHDGLELFFGAIFCNQPPGSILGPFLGLGFQCTFMCLC